jgi:arylsulfatase A-like enzyme
VARSKSLNRRHVIAGAASATLAMSVTHTRAAAPRPRPYNILFIITDQQRSYADVPNVLPLPAQDWLRANGVLFENYCVNTTPCGPARSVIYTGLHTQATGVYLNPNSPPHPQLKPTTPTIGHMLRQAGYRTAYKGKWHLSNVNEGRNFRAVAGGVYPNTADILEPYGFSNYNFDGERVGLSWEGFMVDGATAGDAVRQMQAFQEGSGSDQPWFLAVNFVNPHDIMFYDPTGHGEETRIRPNHVAPLLDDPGDPIYDTDWKVPLPRSFYEDDLSKKPRAHAAINATMWTMYSRVSRDNEAAWLRNQNYYFNCIRDVDRHIATVLDGLRRTGQADNTIIVFTADHGERAGAHGMRQKGGTIYREDIGVPLIVVHPDVEGGRTTPAFAPTLLAMAGVDATTRSTRHPQLKGFDLTPAVERPGGRTRRDQVGILLNYAVRYGWDAPDVPAGTEMARPLPRQDLRLRRLFRGVHAGRYKFARYFAPAEHHIPRTFQQLTRHNDLELYDTEVDPGEINNLAWEPAKHQKLIMRLNAMVNHLIETEVGADDGSEYQGPREQYNTLKLT